MKQTIFSERGIKLLEDDMGICLTDLTEKILSGAPKYILFFKNFIDYMTQLKPPHAYGEVGSNFNDENQNYLSEKLSVFSKRWIDEKDTHVYEIYDSLRHAFVVYTEFGLYGLYKNRGAESWYPKVIIRKKIGSKNFMKKLAEKVIVYRGTSNDEFKLKNFSQSWTTNKDIAYKFAFIHYQGQLKYQNTLRVIVKAKIDKNIIYYYNDDDDEKEVILDERKIVMDSIELCEKRILN